MYARTIEEDVDDEVVMTDSETLQNYTQELQQHMTAYEEDGPFGQSGVIVEVNIDEMAEFYAEEKQKKEKFAEGREGVSSFQIGRATELNIGAALSMAVEEEADGEVQYEALEKELGMGRGNRCDLNSRAQDFYDGQWASSIHFRAGYNDSEILEEEAGI